MKSLKYRQHELSTPDKQLDVIEESRREERPTFQQKLEEIGLYPLKPFKIEIMQVNVGKMCNQVCKHCHVDAGPDRKEIMTRETMQLCLDALKDSGIKTVDLTGGAPEMNPNFRWFVEEIKKVDENIEIIVRCNLTIILANKKYHDLPEFYKKHKINVVSSLPYFSAKRTDSQRGDGVFDKSVKALQMLNAIGYGKGDPELKLDLVYNPAGAFLPDEQSVLEATFKKRLAQGYDIHFDNLFTITNLPVSRFLEYLIVSDNYEMYMDELVNAFNPSAAMGVMCRNTLSVGWDGFLYDCDFNQMLELKVETKDAQHIRDFDQEKLGERSILVNDHCFGCTAGAGSSCGGAIA